MSLEAVAREAGVGIGTLYRHFPTREALVEAVYLAEAGRLCEAADELLAELPPDRALRAWMDQFADYIATKREMVGALRALIADGAGGTVGGGAAAARRRHRRRDASRGRAG